jgi:hypothetical protein
MPKSGSSGDTAMTTTYLCVSLGATATLPRPN